MSCWDAFVSDWNKIPGIRPFQGTPGPGLMKKFAQRLKEHSDPAFWKVVLANVEKSGFLTGSSKSGWRANVPWLLKQVNLEKVAAGVYSVTPNTKFEC